MLTSKALGCFIQLQISAVPIPNCTVGCTLRCMDFGIIKKYSKIKRLREVLLRYSVQLCRNFREISVQIKRFHTDLIAAHLVAIVRLNGLVRCGIQEHPGHSMRLISKLGIFVFHIGKNLIQIARM